MKVLLNETKVFRIDTEEEVQEAIEIEKADAAEHGYILKGYSSKVKEKKSKGEIIDEGYEVTFKREYNTFWEV